MSRHLFFCGENSAFHSILMGWDRSLQRYFLVITKCPNDDYPYYSNILNDASSASLQYYLELLDHYGITLPRTMIEEVRADGEQNIGNKDVLHQFRDGCVVRQLGFLERVFG